MISTRGAETLIQIFFPQLLDYSPKRQVLPLACKLL
jgi:hypothetical protein